MSRRPTTIGWRLAATGAAAAVLGLAACSSSGSTSSASGTASAASASKGTVTVMSIAPENSQEGNHPEVPAAIEAAAMAFNKSGGVDGYQVKVVYCNSQAQATSSAQCAREAVSDKVVAVVGNTEVYGDTINPILQAANIPQIGDGPVEASDFSSPVSFPLSAGGFNDFQGCVLGMAKSGLSKIAIGVTDTPTAIPITNALAPIFKVAKTPSGIAVQKAGVVKVPLTASDYSPYAQALHSEGAQGVVGVMTPQQMEGVMKADSSLGYNITFCTDAANLNLQDVEITASEGTMFGVNDLPPPTGNLQAAQEFRADMAAAQKAGIPNSNLLSFTAWEAWVAMQAFKIVADQVSGPLTAQSLITALNNAKNVNVMGLLPQPWTPVDKARPAAVSRIAENSAYILKANSNGTWSLMYSTPVNMAAALAGAS